MVSVVNTVFHVLPFLKSQILCGQFHSRQAGAAMGKRASTGSAGSRKKGKVSGNGNQKDAIADTPEHLHVRRIVDWFFGSSIQRIQNFNMGCFF